ncbi:MAG: Tellurium resistance protein TerA [Alphaproteobacteria bacterium]|nr:Tellurium resistance protein TerA [Alphaproteobacteria bacterium]MCD8571707.1 Tellurium resistance protein TerA [Alphaproteobacteria bacterium]
MTEGSSQTSLMEANRSRAKFSGHGKALGAAGYREASDNPKNCEFLAQPGQSIAVSPGPSGFPDFRIGVAWDNTRLQKGNFFERIAKRLMNKGIDLDLGCLYELQDGTRGALQAFGDKYGNFDAPPYISLSGDERTGNRAGDDEYLMVNALHWDKIKRMLIYIYIYDGTNRWSKIKPQVVLDIPGENDLYVTLHATNDDLALCAVGGIENVRGGIKLTNYTEYFPGHQEMDRAFGFGLNWGDGKKE